MTTYPGRDHPHDPRLADDLRAGRPGAVAQVYDVYGPRLFDYAEELLGDRDLAVAAVRSALLAARAKSGTVPDSERFRGWLYALVRDECLSRLGDRPRPPAAGRAAAAPAPVDVDEPVRLEPDRLVFHYALTSPGDLEREAADLALRHGLGTKEVAEVLGVSAERAAQLEERIREALTSLLSSSPETLPAVPERPGRIKKEAPRPDPPAERHVERVERLHLPVPRDRAPRSRAGRGIERRVWLGGGRHRGSIRNRSRPAKVLAAASAGAGVLALMVAAVLLPWATEGKPEARGSHPAGPSTGAAAGPVQAGGPSASSPPAGGGQPSGGNPPASPDNDNDNPAGSPNAPPGGNPHQKAPRAPNRPPPPKEQGTGRLAVSDSGCSRVFAAALAKTCQLTLTAQGGAVRWSVASVNDGIADISASGSGVLESGRTTTVTVTVRATVSCYARGFGSGSVGFAPGGVATVSYSCWAP